MSSQPTGKSYAIVSLNDLLKIPAERFEAFARDLQYAVEMTRLCAGSDGGEFTGFVWTDDGNHSVDVNFPGGDRLSLIVTDEMDPEPRP